MKRNFILALMLLMAGFALAQAEPDSIDLPMPQFINPFYDSFAHNYLGTAPAGRGQTGVGFPGGLETTLLNPAAYIPEKASIAVEALIKPPVDVSGFPVTYSSKFATRIPYGLVGVGGKLGGKFTGAVIYSQPAALMMDDWSIEMNQGAYLLQRYPKYYLHQITASVGYHLSSLHFGLSVHNQFHYMDDVPFMRTFERIEDIKYIPRFEPGILLVGDSGNVGMSVTPPVKTTWDLKYAEYETILPLKVAIGTALKHGPRTFLLDLDWEQFSVIHRDYADRLRVKVGFEYKHKKIDYRLGYIYAPQVYEGYYNIPVNTSAEADSSNAWDGVVTFTTVDPNTQHLLSAGFTYNHKYGTISGSVIQSVSKDTPLTQIGLALSFYLEAFKSKDFLRFPDAPKRKNPKH